MEMTDAIKENMATNTPLTEEELLDLHKKMFAYNPSSDHRKIVLLNLSWFQMWERSVGFKQAVKFAEKEAVSWTVELHEYILNKQKENQYEQK